MNGIRVMQLGSPMGLYGAERWILALVRHLDPAEVESIVSVIRDDSALSAGLCDQANALGFRTEIFEAYGRVNWSAVSQLRKYLLGNGVQILHTHGYKTDIIGLLATWRTPCRLVSTPHGWSVQAGIMLRLYESIDRAVFPLFDAVAPLSEAIFDDLKSLPGLRKKLHLIRNAVDVSEIDAVTSVAAEIAKWKTDGQFVLGYIGQIIPRKCLTVLLEAFARLATPRKKLAILGEGSQRDELERLAISLGIRDDVAFFGFRKDRLTFLRGFDVFVLPSRLEGIPRCLMEAMAARIPVVASDIPGCTDLINHGHTGLLFQLGNVESLLGCLTKCMEQHVRFQLGQRGRDFVVANYSAALMARQYQSLYRELVADSTRWAREMTQPHHKAP